MRVSAVPDDIWLASLDTRKDWILSYARKIVDIYVLQIENPANNPIPPHFDFFASFRGSALPRFQTGIRPVFLQCNEVNCVFKSTSIEQLAAHFRLAHAKEMPMLIDLKPKHSKETYLLFDYSKQLLYLSLLHGCFNDAMRFGDGDRIHRCVKFMLPLFHYIGCSNYSAVCFRLLANFQVRLSEKEAEKRKWNRTVSVRGGIGNNLGCDELIEIFNKEIKEAAADYRSFDGAAKVASSYQNVHDFIGRIEYEIGVRSRVGLHKIVSHMETIQKICKHYNDIELCTRPDRQTMSFRKLLPGSTKLNDFRRFTYEQSKQLENMDLLLHIV